MNSKTETAFVQATPGEQPLNGGVHVWRITPNYSDAGLLTNLESEQASKFQSEVARATFISGRAGLRRIASGYTTVPAAELMMAVAPNGKPHFVNAEIQFNLSHSGSTVVAAICRSAVGIDIESRGRCKDFIGIADRFFHPSEAAAVSRSRDEEGFLRLWTGKEAMLKLSGEGLSGGLPDARPGDGDIGFLGGNMVYLTRFSFDLMIGAVATFDPVAVKGWFQL